MDGDQNSQDTSTQMADMVQKSAKAAQMASKAAKIAKGAAAGGGIGAAVSAAWEAKDKLPQILISAFIFVAIICGIVDSIPTAIINWANGAGTADTSDGAQKTISAYNDMVNAVKNGLNDRVTEMKEEAQNDADVHHYVTPDSTEAKIMVTDELRAALRTDITAIIGNIPAALNAINSDTAQSALAPDIISAYTAKVTADADTARTNAESAARSSYETAARNRAEEENEQEYQMSGSNDPSILSRNLDRYINADEENQQAQAAGDAAYNSTVQQADISGKSSAITEKVQEDIVAHPPRTIYKISDAASGRGLDDNSTALAIACYSVAEGNDDKANVSDFEQQMEAGADQYFTSQTTSTTDASTHQTTVTYSLTFVTNGAQKMFSLSDDKYRQALEMAQNLLVFIGHLKGNDDAGDLSMIDQISTSGGGDNPGGSGVSINLNGNVSNLPISNNLIAFIESWEGHYNYPYRGVDSQNLTIGYGHVIKSGENYTFLTDAQMEALLIQDLQSSEYGYISGVQKAFQGYTLTQSQFDALVDLSYNCGPGIFNKVNLTQDIKNGADASTLQADFESICHSDGQFVEGLLRRRHAEWLMFTQGTYQANS